MPRTRRKVGRPALWIQPFKCSYVIEEENYNRIEKMLAILKETTKHLPINQQIRSKNKVVDFALQKLWAALQKRTGE